MTTRLAGTINLGEERQQRTYGTGRRCACGCGTVLSRYNSGHFAYLHEGKRPADSDEVVFGTKACTKCGRELPRSAEHFVVDKLRSDGLTSACRVCRAAASAAGRARKMAVAG